MKKGIKNISIQIDEISKIPGFKFTSAFERRVDENYIIPRKDFNDSFIKREGLYPSSIIPRDYKDERLKVIYEKEMIDINPNPKEKFKETVAGFKQKATERYVIPKKSRVYYDKNKYIDDGSPEDLYVTLIFPEEQIGEVVTIISERD